MHKYTHKKKRQGESEKIENQNKVRTLMFYTTLVIIFLIFLSLSLLLARISSFLVTHFYVEYFTTFTCKNENKII